MSRSELDRLCANASDRSGTHPRASTHGHLHVHSSRVGAAEDHALEYATGHPANATRRKHAGRKPQKTGESAKPHAQPETPAEITQPRAGQGHPPRPAPATQEPIRPATQEPIRLIDLSHLPARPPPFLFGLQAAPATPPATRPLAGITPGRSDLNRLAMPVHLRPLAGSLSGQRKQSLLPACGSGGWGGKAPALGGGYWSARLRFPSQGAGALTFP